MPVPIQASPLNSPSANVTPAHNTYHFHHLGAIWNMTAFQSGSSRHLQIWKSTDNAATWTEQDTANEPVGQLGMFWDGTSDTIWFMVRDPTAHTNQLTSFDMSTGLYGGLIGSASPAFTTLNNINASYLVRYSTGGFRLFYLIATIGDLYYRDFDGVSTWGAATLVRTGNASAVLTEFLPNISDDSVSMIFFSDGTLTGWRYLRVDLSGTLTNDFNFAESLEEMGGSGAQTGCDGIFDVANDRVCFAAILNDGSNTLVIYRGSPISNPTWAAPETIDSTGFSNNSATLILDGSGNERVFWLSYDDNFDFNPQSTIRTSTHSGGVWSAQSIYYSIALNPYSDPNPANCHNDRIYNTGVEWSSGQPWVQFDGTSPNFSPGGSQPNFAFSVPSPTCALSSSVSGGLVTLTWTTTNTPTSARIDQGIGAVNPAGGSLSIPIPGVTTTYILTVSNANGTSTCQTTVTITPPVCTPVPACPEEPVIISHDQPCEALGS